jgi:hypothetical protein
MSNKFKIEIIEAPMINETKQTAVEWYSERLYDLEMAYNQGVINTNTYIKCKREAVEQAKEMEYKQMIEFGAKCIQSHKKPNK